MKKTMFFVAAIFTLLFVGANYITERANAESTENKTTLLTSSAVRYASDALETTGVAVLCGDPSSSSSSSNLNSMMVDLNRYYRASFSVTAMENTAGVCLLLKSK